MSFSLRPSTPEVFMNAYILQTLIINEKFNFLMDRYLTAVSNMEFQGRADINPLGISQRHAHFTWNFHFVFDVQVAAHYDAGGLTF